MRFLGFAVNSTLKDFENSYIGLRTKASLSKFRMALAVLLVFHDGLNTIPLFWLWVKRFLFPANLI